MSEIQEHAQRVISEAASEWVARLQDAQVSVVDQAAFMSWLRESPVHVREFLKSEAALLVLDSVARQDKANSRNYLERASRNVLELPTSVRQRSESGEPGVRRLRRSYIAVAASAAIVFAGLTFSLAHSLRNPPYITAAGEQRHIVLPDGSAVDLNTRSKLSVNFTNEIREVRLADGEAFFAVEKDAGRPFRVISGQTIVRAVGTQFNVRRQGDSTTVTVIEGRVAVRAAREEALLSAGHRAHVTSDAVTREALSAPDRAVAWRQRRLIFENETIVNVIAEFNRYNTRQIVLEDSALAGERINGVFDADKPQNLLDFLRHNTGAKIGEVTGQR